MSQLGLSTPDPVCMWESPLWFLFPSMVLSVSVSEKWNSGICQATLLSSLLCLPANSPTEAVLNSHLPVALAELPVCVHAHSPVNILSTSSLGHMFLLLWGWPRDGGSVIQPLLCPPDPHSLLQTSSPSSGQQVASGPP